MTVITTLCVAQPCDPGNPGLYGKTGKGEHGQCLVTTPENDAVYVAAAKEDSTLLIKVDLEGNWLWSRVIDALPNNLESPAGILVDNDGMIAVSGTSRNPVSGGSLYAFRYDPNLHQILWANEYTHSGIDFNFDITEKGSGGNYLLSTQSLKGGFIDAGVMELDKVTGRLVPDFQKHYHLFGTETMHELLYHEDYLYGVGRYKDVGPNNLQMRHTLVKLDPANGNQQWVKMGHLPVTSEARLYGTDMVIDNFTIFSLYFGDPNGHSASETELYIQRTDLDGNLVWLNRYDIPGINAFSFELIKSAGGYVAYASDITTGAHYLFKINSNGNVLWGKQLIFNVNADIFYNKSGNQVMVEAGGKLVLTGAVVNTSGDADLFIIFTDLEGNMDPGCIASVPISITRHTVNDPVFFTATPDEIYPDTSSAKLNPFIVDRIVPPLDACFVPDTVFTSMEVTICTGDSYMGYTSAGVYTDAYTSSNGCDSLRTLTLVVQANEIFLDEQICAGSSFEGYTTTGIYTDTLHGVQGECDTIRHLDLAVHPPLLTFINAAVCEGQAFLGYTETGLYADTFLSIDGCDSVRTVQLTVMDALNSNEHVVICTGESYQGYTMAGTYVDTFTTASGCDSIRYLQLEISEPERFLDMVICAGDSYEGYTASGTYTDILPGNGGACDTLRTLMLLVADVIETSIEASICAGEQFEGYTFTGTYIDTFTSFGGCDSIRILSLHVINAVTTVENATICLGEILEGYADSGVYTDTFEAISGCDSIRTLALTVALLQQHVFVSICEGQAFEQYTEPGIYEDTIDSPPGFCDTLRILDLHVTDVLYTTMDVAICDKDQFEGYTQPGIYVDTLVSSTGCDSIRALHLETIPVAETLIKANACDPDAPISQPPGIYIDTLISSRGCDSVRIVSIEGATTYVPNVFSPNQDGINDVFSISVYPTADLELDYFAIFDRFGDMVYETTEWPVAWGGSDAAGEPFQPGVFAYIFIYRCGQRQQIEHGDITLVK